MRTTSSFVTSWRNKIFLFFAGATISHKNSHDAVYVNSTAGERKCNQSHKLALFFAQREIRRFLSEVELEKVRENICDGKPTIFLCPLSPLSMQMLSLYCCNKEKSPQKNCCSQLISPTFEKNINVSGRNRVCTSNRGSLICIAT